MDNWVEGTSTAHMIKLRQLSMAPTLTNSIVDTSKVEQKESKPSHLSGDLYPRTRSIGSAIKVKF